jgi:hypothetical protein
MRRTYTDYAEEADRLARAASDEDERNSFLAIASIWRRLGKSAEVEGRSDEVEDDLNLDAISARMKERSAEQERVRDAVLKNRDR